MMMLMMMMHRGALNRFCKKSTRVSSFGKCPLELGAIIVLFVPHWLEEAQECMLVLWAAVSAVCGTGMSAF